MTKITIDEAMAYLSILVEVKTRLGKDQEAVAIQLGLEALSHFQRHRDGNIISFVKKLPSESN